MSQSDIINSRQIQWFPGHMTKTLRLMEKEIRNVDCVLQILDARIPLSSLNPEIERITAGKPHLYVLNKSDLADPEITRQWLAYFKSAGAGCIAMDSKQRGRRQVHLHQLVCGHDPRQGCQQARRDPRQAVDLG